MSSQEEFIDLLIKEGILKTPRIIEAFRAIDRADFVPEEYLDQAYVNYPLPIGHNQTISQPWTVAFLLELLQPKPGEKILDVGSGSGWTAALLTHIVTQKKGGQVYAVERIKELCDFGKKNLSKYDFAPESVQFFYQDGTLGLKKYAPFDKILSGAAAVREIPQSFREQLKIKGKIVAPIDGSVWLFTKKSADEWEEKEFLGFAFVPLINDKQETANGGDKNKRVPQNNKTFIAAGILSLVLIIILLANEIFLPHVSYKNTKTIEILPGVGSRQIAEFLKHEGVIRSKWTFELYVGAAGKASRLKPGTYILEQFTIPQIVQMLAQGETEQSITIPEGWTNKDIAEILEEKNIVSKKKFLSAANPAASAHLEAKFKFISDKPEGLGLEGYLFPDTYRIFPHTDAEEIIEKMLENFGKKIRPELMVEIQKQKKTLFEIITMASLLEKEVATPQDRAVVSGILWKRLKLGIPLQVDATISYIKRAESQPKSEWARTTKNDLRIDSPYNTYKYRGLPQGPIANPGLSSLQAAVFPKKSPYIYYLSAPDGRTIFSQTLEEHNAAKQKYLK